MTDPTSPTGAGADAVSASESSPRPADPAGPRARRTFGIGGLLAVFALLATLGVLAVVLLPSRDSETVQLPAPRPSSTLPGAPATTEAPRDAGSDPPVTVPGGAPAPKGVTKVLAASGSTSYSFDVPEAFRGARVKAAVPPATATPDPTGRRLVVKVSCSLVRNETLAQVSVSEGEAAVTVLPVVLVPDDGDPCPPGTVLATVALPLAAPLGARQVFVAPAGTAVPTPG